jgi:UDPglucose 6-dehydrogenase
LNPDRIIVGEYDARSGDMLLDFWKHFYREKLPPTLRMNLASAEMVKYASNAFLATKVSFINEVANICENVPGVDVAKVAEGMGFDQRIGRSFLRAGAGFGGSCFPKDLKAIIAFSKDKHCEPNILKAVLKVNKDRPTHVVELVKGQLRTLKNKRIAVLGLSFKPGTDDLREAPSLRIIGKLLREGAEVVAYDPVAMENARRRLGGRIVYAHSARSCLEGADTAIVVTEWDEFAKLEPSDFHKLMRSPILIDARRIYDAQIYSLRLRYSAVGLGQSTNDPNQARVLHSTRPEAGK